MALLLVSVIENASNQHLLEYRGFNINSDGQYGFGKLDEYRTVALNMILFEIMRTKY